MPPKNVVFKKDYSADNTVGTSASAAGKAVDAAAMRSLRIKTFGFGAVALLGAYLLYADYKDRESEVTKLMAQMEEEERKAGKRLY